MKAVIYDQFGPIDVCRLADISPPVPAEKQVLVSVRATTVNVIDSRIRSGLMGPLVNKRFPKTPGADVAGVVAAVGPGVTAFKVGDEVFGAADPFKGGAFAESIAIPQSQLARKPDGMSFEQATCLPVAGIAALTSLRNLGRVIAGDEVLIHGASGAVGLFAVQIAKKFRAKVTAVMGTSGLAAVRDFGADVVIDYRSKDGATFAGPFDVIVNASGKLPFPLGRRFLKPGGRLIEPSPSIPIVIGTMLANPFRSKKHLPLMAAIRRVDLETLASMAAENTLRATVASTYPLADFRAAFNQMEKGGTVGKVVVTM